MTNVIPTTETGPGGLIVDIFFDITVIVDKQNNASIVDNKQHDWKDVVDCNTLAVRHMKISVT